MKTKSIDVPNTESQSILVIGGNGFIGRFVVERLRSQGIQPIVTSTRQLRPSDKVVALDLTDREMTARVIASLEPEIVLHLGGVTGDGSKDVNFTGTVNLLRSLETTGVKRVILLGSAAEYGDQPTPFREDMPTRPVSEYAKSRADATEFALEMHARTAFPVTILRVFTAYGFGQPRKMFLSQLITHALLNKQFKMSDGRQKRDLVFVGDVATAILAVLHAEKSVGRVINIAGGRGIPLGNLAGKVWDICGTDPALLEIGARGKTDDNAFDTEADISLAAELLGWQPETPFVGEAQPGHPLYEMIDRMREDIKAHDIPVPVSSQPAQ